MISEMAGLTGCAATKSGATRMARRTVRRDWPNMDEIPAVSYLSGDYSEICRPLRLHSIKLKGVNEELSHLGKFADVCGVHRTYMGHLERGEKNLSFSSIVKVASGLNVTVSELFRGLESGKAEPEASVPSSHYPGASNPAGLERDRVLRELATLERGVRALKKMALAVTDKPSRHAPSKKKQ